MFRSFGEQFLWENFGFEKKVNSTPKVYNKKPFNRAPPFPQFLYNYGPKDWATTVKKPEIY